MLRIVYRPRNRQETDSAHIPPQSRNGMRMARNRTRIRQSEEFVSIRRGGGIIGGADRFIEVLER